MSQKKKLNLVSLHQRHENLSESEMKVVAGVKNCVCPLLEMLSNQSWAEEAGECSCGSLWVIFGLAFG